ncbi:hypothetical protein BJ165DRAFT_690113 [Panaeolus papilionaceus]|nr:hypothetical protein BJ165DRAFT_690113 [Panaeolus papilionaceus]
MILMIFPSPFFILLSSFTSFTIGSVSLTSFLLVFRLFFLLSHLTSFQPSASSSSSLHITRYPISLSLSLSFHSSLSSSNSVGFLSHTSHLSQFSLPFSFTFFHSISRLVSYLYLFPLLRSRPESFP